MALIPVGYKALGVLLIVIAFYDQFRIKSSWRFHAFYTGLALLIAGQLLTFLSGPLEEHVNAIRSLLDQLLVHQRGTRP